MAIGVVILGGCHARNQDDGVQVTQAWEHADAGNPAHPQMNTNQAAPNHPGIPIAIVDGESISRDRIVNLLLRSHGVGVLEQIIVLQGARCEVDARGLAISKADIDAEYDRSLRRLLSPLPAEENTPVNLAAGKRLLEQILSTRNISHAEYMLGMRRNAYLRKIVECEMRFTDEQLRVEFERAYGRRVKARHIQVATFAEAERLVTQLADGGAGFAELARRYSANPNTAPSGGLLRVFSREDEDVPALMRAVAFELEPGQHSAALRVDEWFHILKVEERYPPESASFQEARDELESRLRRRLTGPAMQQLQQTLLQQAEIEILDPVLADEFQRKHPHHTRGPG